MSKLAGHLLQTTPLVLAASLAAQQGASATTAPPVESPDTSAAPSVAVETPAVTEFKPEPSILAADYAAPAPEPVAAAPVAAPEPVVAPPAPAPAPVVAAPVPAPEPVVAAPEPTVPPAVAPTAPAPATIADFESVNTNADALQTPASPEREPEIAAPVAPQPELVAPANAPTAVGAGVEAIPAATPERAAPELAASERVESEPLAPQPVASDADRLLPQPRSTPLPLPQPTAEVNGLEELEVGNEVSPEIGAEIGHGDSADAPTQPLHFEATLEPDSSSPPRFKQPSSATADSGEFVDIDEAIADLEQQPTIPPPNAEATPSRVVGTVTPPPAAASHGEEEFLDLDAAIANLQPISDSAFDALLERIVRENTDVIDPAIAQATDAVPEAALIEDEDESVSLDALDESALEAAASNEDFADLDSEAADWPTFTELAFDALEELEPQTVSGPEPLSVEEILEQVNAYSTEESNGALGQDVFSASQFADVFPSDWAYTALDDLVRRYDCLKGYPNGTFRGNRALSRYEFAAGLNACIQQVERLIAETTSDLATRADLEVIGGLMREFEIEINTLNARVDAMEGRVTFLEDNQFSTTTKLAGEVLFAVADLFTEAQLFDWNYDGVIDASDREFGGSETVFQDRVRLNLLTTFNGRDRLHTRLQARNAVQFDAFNRRVSNQVTNEGAWAFASSSNDENAVEISELNYRTPIGSKLILQVAAAGLSADEIVDSTLNPFDSSGGGALSDFGQGNPIYNVGGNDAGIGLNFMLNDKITLSAGYTNETAAEANSGIFQDGYNFVSQLTFRPNEKVAVAATFSHAYGQDSLSIDTGSRGANMVSNARGVNSTGRPVVGNSYGIQALANLTDQVFLGGWVGYTFARVTEVGDADIWNYALFAGVNDLGGEGNQLGVVIGMEPRLESADASVGIADRSTGLHIEGFYKIKVNKNIEITPGVIWLTAPDHNSENTDMLAGVVRTRFKF
ncbi:MAG: iron uptake porin [Spirulinaceae cyanobacterium]